MKTLHLHDRILQKASHHLWRTPPPTPIDGVGVVGVLVGVVVGAVVGRLVVGWLVVGWWVVG